MPRPGSLTYRPSFLGLTSSLSSSDLVPQQLAPRTMQTLSGTSQISDYSELAWRGFGCSMCGRLSSRSQWTRLVCAGCGAVTDAAARPVGAVELEAKGKGRALEPGPDFIVAPCEPTPITGVRGYDGYSVDLSPSQGGGTARVHHLWPVGPSASEFGDKLFKEYQGPEAGALFRRNTLSRHHGASRSSFSPSLAHALNRADLPKLALLQQLPAPSSVSSVRASLFRHALLEVDELC